MKDRIQQFIDYKGISAGDLSTALDVQRSNISHILNGRNKPGAAFIEKFLLVYPDLNARWLLTGQGDMITENKSMIVDKSKSDSTSLKMDSNNNSNKPEGSKSKAITTERVKLAESDSIKAKPAAAVEKVLLLNSDGTFSTYHASK